MSYADETREALAACSSRNAGSNTAADHETVLDRALEQIPDEHIEDLEILVRADTAGATHGLTDYCREHRHALLGRLRTHRGGPRRDPRDPRGCLGLSAGGGRIGAQERAGREITDRVDLSSWPEGSRLIVRRSARTPARNSPSPTMTATASKRSSPTRPTRTSRSWSAVTASTPTSRTASATTRTPAYPSSRSKSSRSTRCGWRS